ncbi:hypothetical protein ACVWU4_000983 [Campylobacter coli]
MDTYGKEILFSDLQDEDYQEDDLRVYVFKNEDGIYYAKPIFTENDNILVDL